MRRRVSLLLILCILAGFWNFTGCSVATQLPEEEQVKTHFDKLEEAADEIGGIVGRVDEACEKEPPEAWSALQKLVMLELLDGLDSPIKVIERAKPPTLLKELHAWLEPHIVELKSGVKEMEQGADARDLEKLEQGMNKVMQFFDYFTPYADSRSVLQGQIGFPLNTEKQGTWSVHVYKIVHSERIYQTTKMANELGYASEMHVANVEELEALLSSIEMEYAQASIKPAQESPVTQKEPVQENPVTEVPKEVVVVEEPEPYEEWAVRKAPELNILMTGEMIIPDSYWREIRDDELQKMELFQIYLARNEIFARFGYVFKNSHLRAYFLNRNWYRENPSFNAEMTDEVEKVNVGRIKKEEERRKKLPLMFDYAFKAYYLLCSYYESYSAPELLEYPIEEIYSEPFYVFSNEHFNPEGLPGDRQLAVSLLSGNIYDYDSSGNLVLLFNYDASRTVGHGMDKKLSTEEANALLKDYLGNLDYLEVIETKMDERFLIDGNYMYTAGIDSCFYHGTGGNAILYIVDKKFGNVFEIFDYDVTMDLYHLTKVN